MSTSAGRPPDLLAQAVSTLVCKLFKFNAIQTASVTSFPSFEDRNYYFIGQTDKGDEDEYILKMSNPIGVHIDQLHGINQLMNYLKTHGLSLGYPLTDRKGNDVVEVSQTELIQLNESSSSDGDKQLIQDGGAESKELVYYLRVLMFVPGTLLHHLDRPHFVPSLLYSVGERLAKMDKALMNFSNESLEKRHLGEWDLSNFIPIAKRKMAGSSHRSEIFEIIQGFQDTVEAVLPTLKKSIIHFDATELNIIVSNNPSSVGHEFQSFIDFSDAIQTYTVIDLAVSLSSPMTYQAGSCDNVVEFVCPLLRGYNDVLPLSEDELNCLYYLILARCCLLALNCEICYKAEPWNDYIRIKIDKNWNLVNLLLGMSKDEVVRTWKEALL